MIILGIETSCDETAAAVLTNDNNRITILSNVVASSASIQAKYGGIIPEQAAREQIKSIISVIEESLRQALPKERLPRPFGARNDEVGIDAIAVTYGPGLIGSLLVGVETAKTLSLVWEKPLIPINHLLGHFYANWIDYGSSPLRSNNNYSSSEHSESRSISIPKFPYLGLLVSGGHTDLVLFTDHGKYKYLGGTRDDAAGECFDKCARLLGLPYPGGPQISKLASQGDALRFKLPRPMIDSKDFSSKGRPAYGWDFSFSGLKTAFANLIQSQPNSKKEDLAASLEAAIVDVLVEKTIRAAKIFKVERIMIAGGVAANQKLKNDLRLKIKDLGMKIELHIPPANLCTDNAAMIAAAGFFQKAIADPLKLQAYPNLSL